LDAAGLFEWLTVLQPFIRGHPGATIREFWDWFPVWPQLKQFFHYIRGGRPVRKRHNQPIIAIALDGQYLDLFAHEITLPSCQSEGCSILLTPTRTAIRMSCGLSSP
jgi:hypothetical protein